MSEHVVVMKLQSPIAHSCGLLNHLSSFCEGMLKLHAKFDAELLLYSLSPFECDGHTVHMLTQWCLPPPLTSKVVIHLYTFQSTLLGCQFTPRHTNHSHCINDG